MASKGTTILLGELKESFLMAMSAIAAHKLRSALTLLGVLVGVFSIIVVMTAIRVMQNDIEKEIVDARVFGGMHFRHSAMNGAQLGRKVAKHLVDNFFRPTSAIRWMPR